MKAQHTISTYHTAVVMLVRINAFESTWGFKVLNHAKVIQRIKLQLLILSKYKEFFCETDQIRVVSFYWFQIRQWINRQYFDVIPSMNAYKFRISRDFFNSAIKILMSLRCKGGISTISSHIKYRSTFKTQFYTIKGPLKQAIFSFKIYTSK